MFIEWSLFFIIFLIIVNWYLNSANQLLGIKWS